MEKAVLGTWTGTYTPTGGETSPLTVDIRSYGEPARGLSCGSREFSETDGTPGLEVRCMETSSLRVSGTLLIDDDSDAEEVDGWFSVDGTKLDNGSLDLRYLSSEGNYMKARWDNGAWTDCEKWVNGPVASCTLDERVE